MRRTAILLVALAAFTAGGAGGAQVSAAKSHRRSPAATSVHVVHRPAPARKAHHAPAAQANPHSKINVAHRASPDEVGRTAGLAIRRQLAQKQIARRGAGAHVERVRAVSAAESAPASRSRLATDAARSMKSARSVAPPAFPASGRMERKTTVAAVAARTPETGEAETGRKHAAQWSRDSTAAQQPAADSARGLSPAEAQPGEGEEGLGDVAADAERPALASVAQGREDSAAPLNSSEAKEDAGSQPAATASPAPLARPKTETEEASLSIPRARMPVPLRGSLESLERQNARLEADELERIEDEDDLAARIANKLLVPLPASSALTVNADLPENHRYCRPWTARFLADLARAHEAAFHRPLEVSSAVRTVEYQKRLMGSNGNAAAAEGDIVSPHLTGATVDIAKSGLNRQEIAWMRRRLAGLQTAGEIDVEEEFQQACFHITVYKDYAPARPAAHTKAGPHGERRPKAPDADSHAAAEGI